jgi:hypothetical protein
MSDQGKKQKGRAFLGTEFFGIGDAFLESEKDRRIGNMIKLSATLYMCNTEELNGLLEDFDDGTFESMWKWYTDNVTNKVKNPDINLDSAGPISQKYSNIKNVEDDIKKLYDGLPAIPFNNLQGFVSNTFDPEFIISLREEGDRPDYEELSKMLNIVAVLIMISCLNKEYMDKVESFIIKRALKGIESPDSDSIVGTDYKNDFISKYPILNNLN